MSIAKIYVPVFVLCLVHGSFSKPTEHNIIEGRGIGSTLWNWITYPFMWWGTPEPLPENNQLVGPVSLGPYDNIIVDRHNVTVWCNDQTCMTMKCDRFGCVNVTCNIYDTYLTGECKVYNTGVSPEEPVTPKPTEPLSEPTLQETTTKAADLTPSTSVASTQTDPQETDEHPLELEAVLSSTVNESIASNDPQTNEKNIKKSVQT